MKLFVLAGVLAACIAGVSSAETYECMMAKGGGGWIKPSILVNIDEASNTVKIQDALTKRVQDGWFNGSLKVNNQKRFTVQWRLNKFKNSSGQYSNLDFRMTIVKKTMKAQVMMRPHGYDNTFQARGRCAVQKG